MKDFATEPDENKMRKAAHLMVQNLAGSLALVTCKEPLRLSMNNHLKNLLQIQTPEQFHPLVEHAVQVIKRNVLPIITLKVVSADNLDLACTLIEKAATEKAVRDTDDALTAAFLSRKKHRERYRPRALPITNIPSPGVAPPFFDISFTTGRYPNTLPESLKPKLGGLQSHQLRVYDDFSRIPHIQQQQQQSFPGQFPDKDSDRRSPTMFDQSQEALTTGQAVEKFNVRHSILTFFS
jgi:CCR4-NOT transcription complex subunit 1